MQDGDAIIQFTPLRRSTHGHQTSYAKEKKFKDPIAELAYYMTLNAQMHHGEHIAWRSR